MKVLAMYLPQFHHVKENDDWWGEGFTDWVTVKKAKPLYEGHRQPRIPLNEKYYDLLDKKVMVWQSELMKKYSIDGLCMHHYWFKNGKKILERPAENLLQWKDIDLPFCFCWANETWARSWSNIRNKNVWADTFEAGDGENDSGILLEEKYGNEQQWNEHFDYLLPFFIDKRYVKIDGRPIVVIYRSSSIPCMREMMNLWRERAVQEGLNGLYIIGIGAKGRNRNVLDAELYHEPGTYLEMYEQNQKGVIKFNYENVWKGILNKKGDGRTYFGGFVSYDDTPRRGDKGKIIEGEKPDKFSYYLKELMAKNAANGKGIVFVNAWNEWGEGMYLEPDTRYQYGFLEAVTYAKKNYQSRVLHYRKIIEKHKVCYAEIERIANQRDKFEHYLNLLDTWMCLKEKGLRLESWFRNQNYKNISVYGLGMLGKHLLKELQNSEIKIHYIVDQRKERLNTELPVYFPEDVLPDTDIIVVAATFYFDEIYQQLKEKGIESIVSLEQIIQEI